MENGKKDEEGVNNESHNVGERSEGEGHLGEWRPPYTLKKRLSVSTGLSQPPTRPPRNYSDCNSGFWEMHAGAG